MAKVRTSYHHGELRTALIGAAATIIAEQGIEGFSLREAARRAGVAASAPAHHFGTAKGLLTEVALLGYARLGEYLTRSQTDGPPGSIAAINLAYVKFAIENPGLFRLMFRNDLVNRQDERYVTVSSEALAPFAQAAEAYSSDRKLERNVGIFAVWSAIHGMAHLVIEEKGNALFGAVDGKHLADEHLPDLVDRFWAL